MVIIIILILSFIAFLFGVIGIESKKKKVKKTKVYVEYHDEFVPDSERSQISKELVDHGKKYNKKMTISGIFP